MQNQYTSLELAKKLKEVGFFRDTVHMSCYDNGEFCVVGNLSPNMKEVYPAYDLLWDLCVRYKEIVWGNSRYYCSLCDSYANMSEVWGNSRYYCSLCDSYANMSEVCPDCKINSELCYEDGYELYVPRVLSFLQQGKKQEAENYILTYSVLFQDEKNKSDR